MSNIPIDALPEDLVDLVGAEDEDAKATINALSHNYRNIKDTIEEHEHHIKDLKKEYEAVGLQLYERMVAEGLDKIQTEDGSFSPSLKEECAIIAEYTEQVFELLEANDLGTSIKRTVHYQTLNKHYREGDFKIPEDCEWFKTWEKKVITMRRKNVRKFD